MSHAALRTATQTYFTGRREPVPLSGGLPTSRKPTVVTKRNKHKRVEPKAIPVEVNEVPFMAIAEKDVTETVDAPVGVE